MLCGAQCCGVLAVGFDGTGDYWCGMTVQCDVQCAPVYGHICNMESLLVLHLSIGFQSFDAKCFDRILRSYFAILKYDRNFDRMLRSYNTIKKYDRNIGRILQSYYTMLRAAKYGRTRSTCQKKTTRNQLASCRQQYTTKESTAATCKSFVLRCLGLEAKGKYCYQDGEANL